MGKVLHTDDWLAQSRVQSAKLGELGVTSICLAPGESTPGHSHTLVEELTIFQAGNGQIEIENDTLDVCAGSVSVVPAGEFHCIKNTGTENLQAVIVFNSNIDTDNVALKTRKEHFAGARKNKKAKNLGKAIASLESTISDLKQQVKALQ